MRETVWLWLAYRLPKCLVYWASIRLICNATNGKYSKQIVAELTVMDALKRWEWVESKKWRTNEKRG